MNNHQVQWTTPTPLWTGLANAIDEPVRRAFTQPAILRFAADSFMEDFMQILAQDPAQISGLVAQWEDWRGPLQAQQAEALLEPQEPTSALMRRLNRLQLATERMRNPNALAAVHNVTLLSNPVERPLKLYQPAHQRHYLVTACLVCGVAGLPDRTLDVGQQEKGFFVLRRLLPPNHDATKDIGTPIASWNEYAFITTPRGSGWQKMEGTKEALIDGEEQLPLFGMNYAEDDGRRRRLLAGVIPVGKREALLGASAINAGRFTPATGPDGGPAPQSDPRMIQLYNSVIEPWQRLIERAWEAVKVKNTPTKEPPSPAEINAFLKIANEQIQTGSWYLLLDFAKFIAAHQLSGKLNATLSSISYTPPGGTAISLQDALAQIRSDEEKLEKVTGSYVEGAAGWPTLRFAFADAGSVQANPDGTIKPDRNASAITPNGSVVLNSQAAVETAQQQIGAFANLIYGLLLPAEMAGGPLPLVAQRPLDARDGWFVIRCVFDRPNCGPLEPPIVSAPTASFQLASFFDPDAPARPIRIALPMDTTPAGLRKFNKNTAFMISDVLCGQLKRVRGLTFGDLVLSVLPWPFHKDLPGGGGAPCKDDGGADIGMMCSFSIPIITICALILLMIFVTLFDIIFRWMPYFFVCFPLPGFKAKRS